MVLMGPVNHFLADTIQYIDAIENTPISMTTE